MRSLADFMRDEYEAQCRELGLDEERDAAALALGRKMLEMTIEELDAERVPENARIH